MGIYDKKTDEGLVEWAGMGENRTQGQSAGAAAELARRNTAALKDHSAQMANLAKAQNDATQMIQWLTYAILGLTIVIVIIGFIQLFL